MMLGPRIGRYDKGTGPLPLGSPVNAVMGLFVLWWGWLAFNSGRYDVLIRFYFTRQIGESRRHVEAKRLGRRVSFNFSEGNKHETNFVKH